jgi:hypothetical protein
MVSRKPADFFRNRQNGTISVKSAKIKEKSEYADFSKAARLRLTETVAGKRKQTGKAVASPELRSHVHPAA